MPLWRVFAHGQTFKPSQREALAKKVTDLYVSYGLPAFYVNVIFLDVDEAQFWVGGEPRSNFVRIVIEQIGRTMSSPDTDEGEQQRKWWMDRINETVKPFIIDRDELDSEIHISETPRDLWRIQGLVPPPAFSEEEKRWAVANRALPSV